MLHTMQLFPARHTEVSIIHHNEQKIGSKLWKRACIRIDNTSLVFLEDVSMIIDPNYIF